MADKQKPQKDEPRRVVEGKTQKIDPAEIARLKAKAKPH